MESAINYWRGRSPSTGEELTLCPQASALAAAYARMIVLHQDSVQTAGLKPEAQRALADWRASLNHQGAV
jgi:hypothetical protein